LTDDTEIFPDENPTSLVEDRKILDGAEVGKVTLEEVLIPRCSLDSLTLAHFYLRDGWLC
jgi:hypothetical protein